MKVCPQRYASYIDIFYLKGWLEVILGMRIVTTGDSMPSGDRSLIIMNHRTHLDWMYFWPVLVREECGVSTEKIILKSEIKKLPGAGKWNVDLINI